MLAQKAGYGLYQLLICFLIGSRVFTHQQHHAAHQVSLRQDGGGNAQVVFVRALSGAPRRELMDKPNSRELDKIMEGRKSYRYEFGGTKLRATESSDKYHLGVAAPILSQGDLMGCVMLLMDEEDTPLAVEDQRLAQTVAGFLGKQMES